MQETNDEESAGAALFETAAVPTAAGLLSTTAE